MLILKVVFLQFFWFAVVLFGISINGILIISLSIFLAVTNFFVFRPAISIGRFFLSLFYSLHMDTFMTLP